MLGSLLFYMFTNGIIITNLYFVRKMIERYVASLIIYQRSERLIYIYVYCKYSIYLSSIITIILWSYYDVYKSYRGFRNSLDMNNTAYKCRFYYFLLFIFFFNDFLCKSSSAVITRDKYKFLYIVIFDRQYKIFI